MLNKTRTGHFAQDLCFGIAPQTNLSTCINCLVGVLHPPIMYIMGIYYLLWRTTVPEAQQPVWNHDRYQISSVSPHAGLHWSERQRQHRQTWLFKTSPLNSWIRKSNPNTSFSNRTWQWHEDVKCKSTVILHNVLKPLWKSNQSSPWLKLVHQDPECPLAEIMTN